MLKLLCLDLLIDTDLANEASVDLQLLCPLELKPLIFLHRPWCGRLTDVYTLVFSLKTHIVLLQYRLKQALSVLNGIFVKSLKSVFACVPADVHASAG